MWILLFIMCASSLALNALTPEETKTIGQKIYFNECSSKKNRLVFWNANEDFPSLGIGHFIWFPKGFKGSFEQMFPKLLAYFKKKKIKLPTLIAKASHAPWVNRDQFMTSYKSAEMAELRDFFENSLATQAEFIAIEFEKKLKEIVRSSRNKKSLSTKIARLKASPGGLYALIDYHNFKGSGLDPKERRNGQGWGLLQALEALPNNSKDPVADFAATAKRLLTLRAASCPTKGKEDLFLQGWFNRIDRYAAFKFV